MHKALAFQIFFTRSLKIDHEAFVTDMLIIVAKRNIRKWTNIKQVPQEKVQETCARVEREGKRGRRNIKWQSEGAKLTGDIIITASKETPKNAVEQVQGTRLHRLY